MELITPRLLLREFRQTDLDSLAVYASQPELRRYEKGLPDNESSLIFLDRIIRRAAEKSRNHYSLAITVPPVDKAIGHISLNIQNPEIKEWEIGWSSSCSTVSFFTPQAHNLRGEFVFLMDLIIFLYLNGVPLIARTKADAASGAGLRQRGPSGKRCPLA